MNAIQISSLLAIVPLISPWRAQALSVIQFSQSSFRVVESAGSIALAVVRTNDVDSATSVDYSCADGTASAQPRYTPVSGTLSFVPGQTNQAICVPVLNNGFPDGTASFRVSLSNPANGAVLGARA